MNIHKIASGSKGNCYNLKTDTTSILIECGIPANIIRKQLDFNLSGVSACFISHEHLDHSKSVLDLINFGIDCYMSKGTLDALNLHNYKVKVIDSEISVGDFCTKPFKVHHDSAEPLGFNIKAGESSLVFITDSYKCSLRFPDTTHWMIECNYSMDILNDNLKNKRFSLDRKGRLLQSHFELSGVKEFFERQDLSKTKEIHLIHVSKVNGNAELFKQEIENMTGKVVFSYDE